MTPTIGKPAPAFEAAAYVDGAIKTVKLTDYKVSGVGERTACVPVARRSEFGRAITRPLPAPPPALPPP